MYCNMRTKHQAAKSGRHVPQKYDVKDARAIAPAEATAKLELGAMYKSVTNPWQTSLSRNDRSGRNSNLSVPCVEVGLHQ